MSEFYDRISKLSPSRLALLAVELKAKLDQADARRQEPVAIIGMGCRFPGAGSPGQFWRLLRDGVDAVGEVPADRWAIGELFDENPQAPGKMSSRWGGFIGPVDGFDAEFFGIAPREVMVMDPQQRLLLEVVWEALEHSGQAPDRVGGTPTGVFVGLSGVDYMQMVLAGDRSAIDGYVASGASHAIASGRVSYVLGLHGPSLSVDTACSSSLLAVHLACQSLRNDECRMALAAGVNLVLSPEVTIGLSKAGMMAPDGRCKTFDARADGFVRGEGCGVLVLKRLSEAIKDGDRVIATIRGTAVNHDGRSSGLTAPNGLAQEAVLRAALERSGVAAADVDYVEAHGTGTNLGDPIEVRALGAVFGAGRSADRPLLVGSVKTNIGHLEAAAGVAGLIKVALALEHEELPRHLHLETPNPYIEWDRLPIAVTTEARPWPAARRRVAGVSSFGFSGTNVHVMLEGAAVQPPAPTPAADRPLHVLALSARSETALAELAGRYAEHLAQHADQPVADLCYTANAGRAAFDHRLAVVGQSAGELRDRLSAAPSSPGVHRGKSHPKHRPDVGFLFTGQGSQYLGMGRALFETQPTFRQAIERCDALMRPHTGQSLVAALYAPAAGGNAAALDDTGLAQPAIFAVQYALAELWRAWGVVPSLVLGHSVGEYAAACVAGVMRLEDAAVLVATRARLMQALPRNGAMAAVFAPEAVVRARIGGAVSVAAVNGPAHTVISGPLAEVEAACRQLDAEGAGSRRLRVSHAFHSSLMDPMLAEFERAAAAVPLAAPQIGLISNLTGTFAGEEIRHASYWRDHARQPVRFAASVRAAVDAGCRAFVEIGPQPVLLGLARECAEDLQLLPSMRRDQPEWNVLLDAVSALYCAGVTVDWSGFDRDYARRKVAAPTYPFQRQRYWHEAAPARPAAAGGEWHDWLYEHSWQAYETPAASHGHARHDWLIVSEQADAAQRLAAAVRAAGVSCFTATQGPAYARNGDDWRLPFDDAAALERMIAQLPAGERPLSVVFVPEDAPGDAVSAGETPARTLRAAAGLLHLVQPLSALAATRPVRLALVTRGAQEPVSQPGHAALWGLGRTIALEAPDLACTLIDLDGPIAEQAAPLLALLSPGAPDEPQLALRDGRWRVLRISRAAAPAAGRVPVREDGVYLITGGLSGLGLRAAEWLVARGARHLVLVGRRDLQESTREAVRRMQQAGAAVRVERVDVSDAQQVMTLVESIGGNTPLRGVMHCAGVTDDGVLAQQTAERMRRVMAAKVDGAVNLHAATRGSALDWFVMFSSGASFFGSAGQGNYAAANAFLDGLAQYRTLRGLPALSIGWGAWSGTGMAARRDLVGRIQNQGIKPIETEAGLQVLGALLQGTAAQVAVLPIEWSILLERFGSQRQRRQAERFAVAPAAGPREEPAAATLVDELAGATPARVRAVVADRVARDAARTLGRPEGEPIDPQQPLMALGLDSLMAVQLRNTLSAAVGAPLPATVFFSYPSVGELAEHLSDIVVRRNDPPQDAAGTPADQADSSALDDLSEAELADLLAGKLKLS